MKTPSADFEVSELAAQSVERLNGAAADAALDVLREVALARLAQRAWAERPLAERLRILRKARHLIAAQARALAQAVPLDRRSSAAETLVAEVLPLADSCRFLEREARKILKPRRLGIRGRPLWLVGVRAEIQREPFGVVLIVGPSNYPLFLAGSQALQALAAGNAVILKPGQGGGPALRLLADILGAAGLDPRLIRILPEDVASVQAAIEAGVDKVVLTGSARAGSAVLAQLAPRLVPAAMELSGCDAAFVRADADLDLVVHALRFGLSWNRSETCIAPRRVFVDRAIAPQLQERLQAAVAGLAPVEVRSPAAAAAARLIEETLRQGARLLSGRLLPGGEGITPAVVVGVSPGMPLLREEVFAPVVTLVEVADEEEALVAAAGCPYALGATVFGEEGAARALAARVHAGSVVVNDVIVPTADPRLPFGGRGRSGFGVTRGAEGLLELTTIKVVMVRRGRAHWHLDLAQAADEQLFEAFIRATHGGSWRQRLAGWWAVLRAVIRRGRGSPPS